MREDTDTERPRGTSDLEVKGDGDPYAHTKSRDRHASPERNDEDGPSSSLSLARFPIPGSLGHPLLCPRTKRGRTEEETHFWSDIVQSVNFGLV